MGGCHGYEYMDGMNEWMCLIPQPRYMFVWVGGCVGGAALPNPETRFWDEYHCFWDLYEAGLGMFMFMCHPVPDGRDGMIMMRTGYLQMEMSG